MTKISNQDAFIPDTDINGKDYLIGTDIDKGKNTSNFRVEDLGKYFNSTKGVRSFDFEYYIHNSISPTPVNGQFYSNNNEVNPYLINYFIVSKKTKSNLDVYSFFQSLVAENPFDLVISQNVDVTTVFYFKIDSIEIDPNYIKLNVSRVFYPDNKELEYRLSFATFNLKASATSGTSYTDEEAQDAVGNILMDSSTVELEYDDNAPSIVARVLPGSITTNELANNIPTSEFTNDGADGTSTYVEHDELGAVATSNNYNDLSNIPTSFPPSAHNHVISDVTGLQGALDGKEDAFLKNTAFNKNFGSTAGTVTEGNDSRLSDARSPLAHTHVISDVTGLQSALDNKQATLTEVNFGAFSDSLTEKTSIVDADKFNITDSADANKQKRFTFANLKTALTTFFNGLFAKVNLDSTTITGGTGVTINTGDNTKFDINFTGKIVNSTTFASTPISVNLTAQTVTHIAAQPESYVWVNSSGTVIQSLNPPGLDLYGDILGYWVLIHSNKVNLNVINDFGFFTNNIGTQLQQLLDFDGFRKKKGTNIVSAGTTGTRLTHSGGFALKAGGGGFALKKPVINLSGATDATFRMRMRDDSEGADTQTMGVTSYDLNGVLTTISNNKFVAHKVWKFSSSIIRVQRGQKQYDNLDSAIAGISVDAYVDMPNGAKNGIHIGWVVFKKGTSWGSGGSGVANVDYKFIDVGAGTSSGTATLPSFQAIYNISTLPQIITNAIRGAFQIQGGTGVDTDNIFEGKNNAGTLTSWIKADGTSSFGGASLRKQTYTLTRDWLTSTLDRVYYISFNNNAIEHRPVGTNNTVIDSLHGRNVGMFIAPYNCKITKIICTTRNTGSFTGKLGLGSGKINAANLPNDFTNKIVHLDSAITSSGYVLNEYVFPIVGGATITAGDVISPTLYFSAQAQTNKQGVTIQIEIEEV